MSTLNVEVKEIETIKPHRNADNLELAYIEGTSFKSCVQIGEFEEGDLVAYIPPDSLVPKDVQRELGVEGYLAGSDGNRVKSIRLRGVLSQGLLYPAKDEWEKGQDVNDELGIEKYEPPIPTQMNGQVYGHRRECCIKYDIENYRHYPDVLESGEKVVFTEKVHGTFSQHGWVSKQLADDEYGQLVVGSKGLLKKRQPFQPNSEENENNLYLRCCRKYELPSKLESIKNEYHTDAVFILGEVFGETVQDLGYGRTPKDGDIGFRAFDIYVGPYLHGRYVDYDELTRLCDKYGIPQIPALYRGPFDEDRMWEYASGMETLSGRGEHIREGVIVRPVEERVHDELGRVQLKAKSPDYVTRNGGTEYQ